MKRILAAIVFVLLGIAAFGAPVQVKTGQLVVAWDPVTQIINADGTLSPLPAGDTITYELWLQPATSAGAGTGTNTLVTTTPISQTQAPVTLAREGYWLVTARAIRVISGGGPTQPSDYSAPLFLAYAKAPAAPANLRVSP